MDGEMSHILIRGLYRTDGLGAGSWSRQMSAVMMPIESALDMLYSEIARLLREYRLLFGTEVDGAVMLHSGAFLSTYYLIVTPGLMCPNGRKTKLDVVTARLQFVYRHHNPSRLAFFCGPLALVLGFPEDNVVIGTFHGSPWTPRS